MNQNIIDCWIEKSNDDIASAEANSLDKNKIDELYGKYKDRLSSSTDFAKNKKLVTL